ncbi:MAG: serine--tRNA ligase, partial [Oscillospiraceae bacterium]|nr:serine--tRNA ligase [Oscillospiraceae bacterium]
MLDIKKIREEPDEIIRRMHKRVEGGHADIIGEIVRLDTERRVLLPKIDGMKAQRNSVSKGIPQIKREGGDVEAVAAEMRELGESIDALSKEVAGIESQLNDAMLSLPNLPDDDLPAGDAKSNIELRVFGEKSQFSFDAKGHIELCEALELIDYKRGVKLGGNGSWLYRGDGARLEWALLNFFINEHVIGGYELLLPPHLLGWESGYTAGQFPKFADDVYQIANPSGDEKKFLLPTAETALVNVHRDEILDEKELPKKYVAFTPCYRREAGSYRSEERGMIRGHQFNKVEMFQYTTVEGSDSAFDEMVGRAEEIMRKLGLCHRVVKLAAADISASMARTYDIEVFIPSIGIFKEVSSASNSRDFQSRRGN